MQDDIKLIPDECGLLRRIPPSQIVHDANVGKRRLSSGAFRAKQLSADAECLLAAVGLDWKYSLLKHSSFFLIRLNAGFARQHSQTVQHAPLPDNPFHAEVVGRKSDPICTAFRNAAEWVKKPIDV